MSATIELPVEQREAFACFGSRCTVVVADARVADARAAVVQARRRLLEWHGQFSRFLTGSELTRLNDAPEETVPVSPMMRRVVEAAVNAARATGGLVDPTLLSEIERAGYDSHFDGDGLAARSRARARARSRARSARARTRAGDM